MEMDVKGSEMPWIDDDALRGTTKTPDIIEEGGQVTLAIFLIIAVATIALLFALGIFIDCRHQKIDDEEAQRKRTLRKLKLKIPNTQRTLPRREDKDCIIENMEENEASTSNGIV